MSSLSVVWLNSHRGSVEEGTSAVLRARQIGRHHRTSPAAGCQRNKLGQGRRGRRRRPSLSPAAAAARDVTSFDGVATEEIPCRLTKIEGGGGRRRCPWLCPPTATTHEWLPQGIRAFAGIGGGGGGPSASRSVVYVNKTWMETIRDRAKII
jgi:hypothetical protein